MTNQIIDRIKTDLKHNNKNFLALIAGKTGSGKSWAAIRLASLIDPTFTIDNVVFTQEEFMALLNSGKLHKGSAIVWDEVGVAQSSREWFTITNKVINYVLQTFRKDNLAVIFTAPSFDFIDSLTRQLFHVYIRTTNMNKTEGYVRIKWYELSYSDVKKKLYRKRPIINGAVIDSVKMLKPAKSLIKAYEQRQIAYKDSLKKDIESDIRQIKQEQKKERLQPEVIAAEILLNPSAYTKTYGGKTYISQHTIEARYNVGWRQSRRIKSLVEDKLNNQPNKTPINQGKPSTTPTHTDLI